jgi:beta-lactam-binding protein with PASTA domain
MRICPSCGRENAEDGDFCECGEYLRWEPTQHITALKPSDAGEQAAASAGVIARAPAPAAVTGGAVDAEMTLPPGQAGRPLLGGDANGAAAVAVAVGTDAPREPPPGVATLLLRLPENDAAATGPVTVLVKPGERATLLALIRNESGIVDNYDISVTGLNEQWWTVTPPTAYLVPYGTSGNYEQEIQVHLHPPKTPDAQARPWSFEVVAVSRAYGCQVAGAAATLSIEPYQDVAAKLYPDRASGRLKARFKLTVSNRANAPVDVVLAAEDADGECHFRFAQPMITLSPGGVIEAPFTVLPPKQLWIGRPRDRQVRVIATPAGVQEPDPPLQGVYRQRPWFPWWLSFVVPIAIALIALFVLTRPTQATVPNLRPAQSVFAAQKLITAAGLKLSPQVRLLASPNAAPGAIVDQSPAAGKKVKRGTLVNIEVATGSGSVKVPSVVGLTPVVADTALRASGLVLGAVSPKPNPDGKIASQIPAAQVDVATGTPVAVFLALPASGAAAAGAGGGAGKAAEAGSSGAGKAIVLPAPKGDPMTAAQQLSQLGLVPTTAQRFDRATRGTLIGTEPVAGAHVASGSKVAILISAGSPWLSYDDGSAIHVVDGMTGKSTATVPAGAGSQQEAAWSTDGSHLAYVQGRQLWLLAPARRGAQPFALTGASTDARDPAFAPTSRANILAFIERGAGGAKLCFATIGPNTLNPNCTSHPGFDLGRQVAWSPDGSAILVFGSRVGHPKTFGLIEFVSNVPFSTRASDWGRGQLVTDASHAGEGVIGGQFSPDGKRLALISNLGTRSFHLFLAPRTDFTLARAKALPVRACEVSWRSDGHLLAVMEADPACQQPIGDIVAIDPRGPSRQTVLATNAAHPAWQPVPTRG